MAEVVVDIILIIINSAPQIIQSQTIGVVTEVAVMEEEVSDQITIVEEKTHKKRMEKCEMYN